MKSQEFQLASGTKLVVTPAPYEDASDLFKAVMKAVKGLSLSEKDLQTDIERIKDSPAVVAQFLDKILSVAVSDEVEEAIFKCGQRAAYSGIRVTRELFDDEKIGDRAREDHYQIWMKIVEVNCLPFFKQAFSAFETRPGTPTESPRST